MKFLLTSLAVALIAIAQMASADDRPATITMTGTGTASVVPNTATVSVGVQTIADTAAEALEANNAPTSRIIALMKAAGVAPKDIATQDLSVFPRFERRREDDRPPRIVGYQVQNTLNIRVRELGNLGGLLDQAITAGATTISQISFGHDDLTEAMDRARVNAVKDATRKAGLVAEAAGVSLRRLLSVSEQGSRPAQVFVEARSAVQAAPIEAGSQGHAITVTMVWEIGAP